MQDLRTRLLSKRRILGKCWIYTGGLNKAGYGLIQIGSRTDGTRRKVSVHRLAYTLWVGPIPDGHDVHHDEGCLHSCFNPDHLNDILHDDHHAMHNLPEPTCRKGH